MDKQWKVVPVERSYDMRVKALMAFNTAQREGKDRDDALDAAFQAMLDAAPPPPSASDERERFEAWAESQHVTLLRDRIDADRYRLTATQNVWDAWQARAALAPSPGVDAAEQKPGKFKLGDVVRKSKGSQWHGTVVGTYSTALTPEGYAVESSTERGSVQIYPAAALVSAEPSPAASADEWMAKAERLVWRFSAAVGRQLAEQGSSIESVDARAALLAHLKARP